MTSTPFEDFGGDGPYLHFGHANGYPPTAYKAFLQPLTTHYHVQSMHLRPLWPGTKPEELQDWNELADELLDFLEAQGASDVIGVGHSLGAVTTMLAALKRPEMFSKLVLIEPVFLPPWILFLTRFMPMSLRYRLMPLIPVTLRRRTHFGSHDEVYESFRGKKVFRYFSDEVLRDLVESTFAPSEQGGVELVYTKEWEARIYSLPPQIWRPLKKVQHPVLGFRGEKTDTIFPKAWEKWKSMRPQDTLVEIPQTSHLIPLEIPEQLASQVIDWLQNN